MGQIVDYSTARPDLAAVRRAGYVGAARYLAPLPNPKVVTPTEATDILSHGLALLLVWEGGASRAGAGKAAGVFDATEANRQADILGAPADLPIFFAVDYDAAPGAVEAYFRGAATGRRPVAVYGSFRIVEWLVSTSLAVKGWQTAAWSHGAVSKHACLFQRVGNGPIPGTDVNDVLHPDWGQWPRPAAQPPKKKETDMGVLMRVDGDPQVWVVGSSGRWAVGSPWVRDALRFSGVVTSAPNTSDGVVVLAAADGDEFRKIPQVVPLLQMEALVSSLASALHGIHVTLSAQDIATLAAAIHVPGLTDADVVKVVAGLGAKLVS